MTTLALTGKSDREINKTIDAVMNSVKKVNGTFSMIFSNTDFSSERDKTWRKIFSEKMFQHD
ncbi:MAG TPA: hypothetical protein DEG69_11500 [Flavobacteriaceae bacterium]|nr:hypothetical protein [Flavobacteriaceae bacterium]